MRYLPELTYRVEAKRPYIYELLEGFLEPMYRCNYDYKATNAVYQELYTPLLRAVGSIGNHVRLSFWFDLNWDYWKESEGDIW